MSEQAQMDHLQTWIGTQERESDIVTPELLKRFSATLSDFTQLGTATPAQVPSGIHWCLALPAISHSALGEDGHPAKGGFLPPISYPQRMWASSRIQFHKNPSVNAIVERTSTIADVVSKQSTTSGPLMFVHVDHVYTQGSAPGEKSSKATPQEVLIQERQTLVFREPAAFKKAAPQASTSPAIVMDIRPDSTLLSRYCGLTFNSHRIHYDHNYATRAEGYPGLVVQGPLMATLLMNFAQAKRPDCLLQQFEFKGLAPAFVDQGLQLLMLDPTGESLEIRNHEGALIMSASAKFASLDGQ